MLHLSIANQTLNQIAREMLVDAQERVAVRSKEIRALLVLVTAAKKPVKVFLMSMEIHLLMLRKAQFSPRGLLALTGPDTAAPATLEIPMSP